MPLEVSTFGTSLPKIRQTRKLRPVTESNLPESIELSKDTPGPACGGPERRRSALGTRSGTELGDSVAAGVAPRTIGLLCARLFPPPFKTFP